MNQSSRTTYSLSSTYLFNELNIQFKFSSFGSWIKFNELIVESNSELYSSWFGSLPVPCTIIKTARIGFWIPFVKSNQTKPHIQILILIYFVISVKYCINLLFFGFLFYFRVLLRSIFETLSKHSNVSNYL